MYKIPDANNDDFLKTIKGMDTDGNLIAYCKLPEYEEEENIELTESEHDDIMFGRYI